MKRFILSLAGLAIMALIGFGLIVGCGDDHSTKPTELKPGNVNDPSYQFASGIFNAENMQLNMLMLGLAMELIDSIPVPGMPAKPFKISQGEPGYEVIHITSYNYQNFWHIFEIMVTATGEIDSGVVDSFYFSGIDSIRFEGDAGPMQYPDSALTNALKLRWHFDVDASTVEGQIGASEDASYDLNGTFGGDFYINGQTFDSASIDYITDTASMGLDLASHQTVTDILIDEMVQAYGYCPPEGVIGIDASLNLEYAQGTDTLALAKNWDISFVFHEDRTVTVTYIDGTYRWVVTEDCGGGAAKPVFLRAMQALKK